MQLSYGNVKILLEFITLKFFFGIAVVVQQSLTNGVYFILMLDDTNYFNRKDSVHFTLEYMDLDFTLRVEQLPTAVDIDT